MDLTGKQRTYLRGLAHHLDPVVTVGPLGVSPAIVAKTAEELEHHELIKVKVTRDAPAKARILGTELADEVGAHHVQTIGRICVLYKARQKKPAIKLPSAS